MARPRKIVDSDQDFDPEEIESKEFKITRVFDPTAMLPRELDAYSQEELDRFLASGWLVRGG